MKDKGKETLPSGTVKEEMTRALDLQALRHDKE